MDPFGSDATTCKLATGGCWGIKTSTIYSSMVALLFCATCQELANRHNLQKVLVPYRLLFVAIFSVPITEGAGTLLLFRILKKFSLLIFFPQL